MSQKLITNLYYSDSTVDLPHTRHRHNVYEMLFVVEGSIACEIAGKHVECHAPALVFIANYEPHFVSATSRSYARFVLTLDPYSATRQIKPSLLTSVFSFHPIGFSHVLDVAPIREELVLLLRSLEREWRLPEAEKTPEGEALLLSALLYRIRQFSPSHFSNQRFGTAEMTVSSVRMELEQGFAQPLNLNELAARHHVSRYYLSHIFKQVTGYGLKEYRMLCRISYASRRLEEGSTPIHTIAEEAGFHDMSNFSRAFKEMFGISPSEFRRRAATPHSS